MMDDALQIFEYLPLSFKSESEQEYINFLWDAFQSNYLAGKYQFAFLAFHMLTMSFVYFTIWQIKRMQPDNFGNALIGFESDENQLLTASSPFTFHIINERRIFRFLKLIGCKNDKIGKYKVLVDERNHAAHPNGQIRIGDQRTIDAKIVANLKLVDEIEQQSKPVILDCYEKFITESFDPDTREFPESLDQIKEILVHSNYFSQMDVSFCLDYDITRLSTHPDFGKIQDLHNAFVAEYKRE
ncbi:MAG: hypothetical protein HZC40_18385 [Chloroflexi bacterium]|nr:hypothetical protein [Chloroflexota bacterium]